MDNLNTDRLYTDNNVLPTAGRVNFNTTVSKDFATNEAYKTLRTNLLFCGSDVKIILITSAHENEGKSTISTEISKSLAEINKKTLLIDADMRKSVILKRNLKSQSIMGLSELLSGQATIGQVLYNTQIPDFDVIFSGHFPPNPVELVSTENFKLLLNELREVYDYIIIDCPPLGPVIDASVISTQCDGAVIIISAGNTSYQEVISTKEQLQKSGCRILGAILNETNPKKHKVYKYYKKNNYYYTNDKSYK